MKFGVVFAPVYCCHEKRHPTKEHSLAQLCALDRLGYDYAWLDDAHPLSPASAICQTTQITLGRRISAALIDHPFLLANQLLRDWQSSHQRLALGFEPDAIKPGLDADQRRETSEAVIRLLQGEILTQQTRWFKLDKSALDAWSRVHPGIEMAVTTQISPAGAKAAATLGLGMISIAASTPGGINNLATNWEIYERTAAKYKQPVNRDTWSLGCPVHLSTTRKRALAEVNERIKGWVKYYSDIEGINLTPEGASPADALVDNGMAVIGTPTDATRQIRRLREASGGFGTFLLLAHHWADWRHTMASYNLFAEKVAPAFR